tara:strand:+ start:486 stop:920 length:435 start_codon:yes stop_codon:yes gene_type:complete
MHGYLTVELIREQTPFAVVQRNAGFVARSFDAQNAHVSPPLWQGRIIADSMRACLGLWRQCARIRASVTEEASVPFVKVKENEPFDVALRRFKRSCEKAGILAEVRRREYYEKPTAVRKRKAAAAVKRHAKKLQREAKRMERLY